MTNDATRAIGEAMPKTNRRTALALTGAGLAGIFASASQASGHLHDTGTLADPVAAAKGVGIMHIPSGFSAEFLALLSAHERLWNAEVAAFKAYSDRQDEVEDDLPQVQVQVGKLVVMDGHQPIYRETPGEIRAWVERDRKTCLGLLWGSSDTLERREKINRFADERLVRLMAEWEQQDAAHRQARKDCGLDALWEKGDALCNERLAVEKRLRSFNFRSVAELRALIVHLHRMEDSDEALSMFADELSGKAVAS